MATDVDRLVRARRRSGGDRHVAVRQRGTYPHARLHIVGLMEQGALDMGRRAAQRLCAATSDC